MRCLQAGWVVLAAVVLSGCPTEFGKDGRIDKATAKDTAEMFLTRCSQARIEEVCGNGKSESEECKQCRGR